MLDLSHHFLIAMPSMVDEDFQRSVLYIFDHGPGGAAALVINRPSETQLSQMFVRMGLPLGREDLSNSPVFFGGPLLTDRGFVLHEAQQTYQYTAADATTDAGFKPSSEAFWASTLRLTDGLHMTTSSDVLEALSYGAGPQKVLVSLGYAAWNAGQLEQEIANNDWLTVPAKSSLIFDTPPAERYQAALSLLGIDEVMLGLHAGGVQ